MFGLGRRACGKNGAAIGPGLSVENFRPQSKTDCQNADAAWQADRKARPIVERYGGARAEKNRISHRQAAPEGGPCAGPKNRIAFRARALPGIALVSAQRPEGA